MTKSSVDRKRSRYGEKYSLRFHKQLKIYTLTCNDEIPYLIAKFVETDGDLAMKLFERLESNYKENEQLKQRNENQYNQLTELWQIIEEENWEKLIAMKKQLKEDEERLQQEWKCYE